MRLRRAVPKIPPKSSVPHRLPLHKSRTLLTHSESTLPQVLIPLHFNFPRINTYKKPGGGCPSTNPRVLQPVTTLPASNELCGNARRVFNFGLSTVNSRPLSPFPATLTSRLQIAENKTTLSPAVATLTDCVKHKSFVCHSYKKHRGWGTHVGLAIAGRLFSGFPRNTGHGSRVTDHRPMVHSYRCAPRRKVPESHLLLIGSTPGNISAPPVSNRTKSGHRVRHPQTAKPGRKSIPVPCNAGVVRARRPGSTVLRRYKVGPTSRVARAS